MTKKILRLIIPLVIGITALVGLSLSAGAEDFSGQYGDFTVTCADELTENELYFAETDKLLCVNTDKAITVSNTGTTKHAICVGKTDADITLAGVNIDVSDKSYGAFYTLSSDAISLKVTLAEGTTNTLKSGAKKAGLGVGSSDSLIIEGPGTLIATGGKGGAGIGGNNAAGVSNITINGGKIHAIGGTGAAGIGAGQNGHSENIVINGGTITATGGACGAGIGSGYKGNSSSIVINGGKIHAIGGSNAAGIGAGQNGRGGNIVISGAAVQADAGEGSAEGIGCSFDEWSSNGTITIKDCASVCGNGTIGNLASDVYMDKALMSTATTITTQPKSVADTKKWVYRMNLNDAAGKKISINGADYGTFPEMLNGDKNVCLYVPAPENDEEYCRVEVEGGEYPIFKYKNGYNRLDLCVKGGTIGTDFTYENNVLTIKGSGLTVSGKSTTDRIVVENGVEVMFDGVDIDVSAKNNTAAVAMSSGGTITLVNGLENRLVSGSGCAGLQMESGNLAIYGAGALYVEGGADAAGIGGSAANTTTLGTITIEGGNILAKAGEGCEFDIGDSKVSNIRIKTTVDSGGGPSVKGKMSKQPTLLDGTKNVYPCVITNAAGKNICFDGEDKDTVYTANGDDDSICLYYTKDKYNSNCGGYDIRYITMPEKRTDENGETSEIKQVRYFYFDKDKNVYSEVERGSDLTVTKSTGKDAVEGVDYIYPKIGDKGVLILRNSGMSISGTSKTDEVVLCEGASNIAPNGVTANQLTLLDNNDTKNILLGEGTFNKFDNIKIQNVSKIEFIGTESALEFGNIVESMVTPFTVRGGVSLKLETGSYLTSDLKLLVLPTDGKSEVVIDGATYPKKHGEDNKIFVWLTAGSYDSPHTLKMGDETVKFYYIRDGVWGVIPEVIAPTLNKLTYNGKPQELFTPGYTSLGKIVFYKGGAKIDGVPTETNAGTYSDYSFKVEGTYGEWGTVEYRENNNQNIPLNITIDKAKAYVIADDVRINKGDPIPTEYTYRVVGAVGSDKITATASSTFTVVDTPTWDTIKVENFKCNGGECTNYNVTGFNGTLYYLMGEQEYNISAEDMTISYADVGKKIVATKSTEDGYFTYSPVGTDVISVDENGVITTVKPGVEMVKITLCKASYYIYAYKYITVTVTKAPVTVTAPTATIDVGDSSAFNALKPEVSGLKDGGALGFEPKYLCSATDANTIGVYPTTIVGLNPTETEYYTITYKNGKITVKEKSTPSNPSGGGSSSGGSYGGGGGGSSSGGSSGSATLPSIGGVKQSWSNITTEIKNLPEGGKLTVELNGNTSVPATVIAAIGNADAVVTFKISDKISVTIDGSEISGTVGAADLSVANSSANLSDYNFSIVGGTAENKMLIGEIGVPARLNLVLDKKSVGKFANMMKLNKTTGKMEFVDVVRVNADGTASLKIGGKGDYVIVVDKETKMPGDLNNDMTMNAKDAATLLRSIVNSTELGKFKADYNNDNNVNAKDAAKILRTIVD